MLDDMAAKGRHWFRFHLTTAVLLMLTVGALLWANTRVYERPRLHFVGLGALKPGQRRFFVGWPETCWMRTVSADGRYSVQWFEMEFLFDVFVALVILGAEAFLCEWWFRRSEMKAHSQRC